MPENSVTNLNFTYSELFKKVFFQVSNFLVESNIIIATGATLLSLETLILAGDASFSTIHLLVVFFSAMVVYHLAEINFSLQLDPVFRVVINSDFNSAFHRNMLIVSMGLLLVTLPFLKLSVILLLSILGIITMLYGLVQLSKYTISIRKVPLLKNIVLAAMWAIVTVLFPLFAENVEVINIEIGLIFIERFLFILVLSLMFDLRDFKTDPGEGLKTIATMIGYGKTKIVAQSVLGLLLIVTLFHFLFFIKGDNIISIFIALVLSLLITSFFIFITNNNKAKYFYSLLFDGATVIQAVLVLLLSLLIAN